MSDTGKTIALIKALAPAPEIDPEEIKQDVEDWLDDHPEATTTVQDGAITKAKLNASLQETVDDVDALKTALTVNTTITWNQLSKLANNWAMNWGAGTVTKNNDEIIVANAPANYYAYTGIATTPTANHKYLFMCYAKASNATAGIYLYISDSTVQATTTSGDYTLLSAIATASRSSVTSFDYTAQLRCFASSSGTVYFKNPKMFDLTMLGLDGITSADDFVRVFPDWSSSGVDTTGTQRKLTFIEDFALKNFNRQYYINAKDMGAVGDGTTDDTAALQKCIDYGAENGLSVFIPAGMYMISSTLNNKGTTVFGASLTTADEEYGTTIKATSAMSAMMTTITGSGENYNETAFKHLTFNGNQLANIGISISKGLELDDVYCIGAVYSGAHFTDCYRGLIKRSIFNHNGCYGVRLTHRNNNVVFVNCIMNDNGSASGHANVMI